jgi:hypothetical protein
MDGYLQQVMFEYTSNEELLITLFDGFSPDKMQH